MKPLCISGIHRRSHCFPPFFCFLQKLFSASVYPTVRVNTNTIAG
ncbi:hypothetical protein HMPREF1986_01670 [Oribacterium sp. oral taxon 078 str. F0263]|nr:hypothetical protein HMPREF1986_01670 [Oribacterium sp. oral taxon 078 str. F0263]